MILIVSWKSPPSNKYSINTVDDTLQTQRALLSSIIKSVKKTLNCQNRRHAYNFVIAVDSSIQDNQR